MNNPDLKGSGTSFSTAVKLVLKLRDLQKKLKDLPNLKDYRLMAKSNDDKFGSSEKLDDKEKLPISSNLTTRVKSQSSFANPPLAEKRRNYIMEFLKSKNNSGETIESIREYVSGKIDSTAYDIRNVLVRMIEKNLLVKKDLLYYFPE